MAPPTQNNSVSSSPFLRFIPFKVHALSLGQGSRESAVHWLVHLITWAFASHVRGLALVRRIGGGRSPRLRFPPTAIIARLLAYIGIHPTLLSFVLLSRCPRLFYPPSRLSRVGCLLWQGKTPSTRQIEGLWLGLLWRLFYSMRGAHL